MPFVKIHVLEERYAEARLDRVSNAIQQTLRTELGMAPDELFQLFTSCNRANSGTRGPSSD